MKRTILVLVLGALLGGHVAAADDDERGWAGFDKGFRFSSEDGDNTLRIGARAQVRFTEEDPDVGDGSSSFRLRRLKLKLSGQALGQFDYAFQAEMAGGSVRLDDAYVVWKKHRMAKIWAGQGKIFFNRQNLTSSGKQQFVDRSIARDITESQRDQGVALLGQNERKTFEYQVGVYNGNGVNVSSNDDDNLQYVGRVVFTPLGEYKPEESSLDRPEKSRLAIGAKFLAETVDDAGAGTETDSTIGGIELAYKLGGFNAVSEYFFRTDDVTAMMVSTESDTDSYYVQLGYLFENKPIEVALRYAEVSPEAILGASQDRTETGGALSWYIRKHATKLQFDLRKLENEADPTQDTTEARLQFQIAI